MTTTGDLSLYFHIPFCYRKCPYCHFYVLPNKTQLHEVWKTAIFLDLKRYHEILSSHVITTIYFGGGTPYLIGAPTIASILDFLHNYSISPLVEVTLEANPEDISENTIAAFQKTGINRISLGAQSLDNDLLQKIGRAHTQNQVIRAVHTIDQTGISNISLDLMYDLPSQTLAVWQKTLHIVQDLPLSHISLYNLVLEPHTAFYKHRRSITPQIPSAEVSTQMYRMAQSIFSQAGYTQYEISAFCRKNLFSRHNVGYWTSRPYIGFGPSAHSYYDGRRSSNISHLGRYLEALKEGKDPTDMQEMLCPEKALREALAISLRLLTGVHISTFQKKWGLFSQDLQKSLDTLEKARLLSQVDGYLKLTDRGILLYDELASEII